MSRGLTVDVALDKIELVRDARPIDTVIMLLIKESPPRRTILLFVNNLFSKLGRKI